MRYVDTELRWAAGRTARELAIIACAAWVTYVEVARAEPNLWHLSYYAAGTLAFALRFYAARAIAMAFAVTAATLHLSQHRLGEGWVTGGEWWFGPMILGIALALLASDDLRQRYDRAPGRFWVNRWRELPRRHWALSCLIGYSLGILGNAVLLPWMAAGEPGAWPLVLLLCGYGAVFLFLAGRSLAFLVAAIVGVAALVYIVPDLAAAEAYRANGFADAPATFWAARPEMALPAAASAAVAVALSAPYAALHLWRTLVSPGSAAR